MNARKLALFSFAAAAQQPAIVGAQSSVADRQLQEYRLDAGHSVFEFSIGFAFSRVKGRFTQGNGTVLYDPVNPANSSVTVVMEAKGIDTGWPHRDEHLRTSDFFDVERFPILKFQSTRLRQNGKDWLMDGQLTMHGVTKAMTVPLIVSAPRRSPESAWMILTATSAFKIARKDFGITGGDKYNPWFNAARMATMADTVDVSLELEGYWADAESQRVPGIVAAAERVKTQGVTPQLDRVRTQLAGKPDSVLMDYFTGADYLVSELLETDRAKAIELARALPGIFKGARAYAVYGHALAVNGDNAGAARQYAEAKRVFKRKVPDPNEKFPQVDNEWYYLDQLARTSLERGRAAAALGVARLAAELYPDNARALATFAWALRQTGDAKEAAVQFARALELDPNESRALELARR